MNVSIEQVTREIHRYCREKGLDFFPMSTWVQVGTHHVAQLGWNKHKPIVSIYPMDRDGKAVIEYGSVDFPWHPPASFDGCLSEEYVTIGLPSIDTRNTLCLECGRDEVVADIGFKKDGIVYTVGQCRRCLASLKILAGHYIEEG